MRELAAQYPRYGYRRIRIFLGRDGHHMSVVRASTLARFALQVPRKRPRLRIALGRPRPTPPTKRNHVWAYDFVFDACADGKQLKCLTMSTSGRVSASPSTSPAALARAALSTCLRDS